MLEPRGSLDVEAIFLYIYRLLSGAGEEVTRESLQLTLFTWWERIAFISVFVTPVLLTLFVYVFIRYHQMRAEELATFKAKAQVAHAEQHAPRAREWSNIMDLVSSDRPSDWRVAVMDADVILDEILKDRGYIGENLGERLKGVDRGDLRSLDQAWEAHKIRNDIAHGGGDYILTQRDARRAIELFRQVFEECGYI